MIPSILTQQQLLTQLKDELGIHAAPDRLHAWIREGMPLAPSGGKKPRFVFAHVRDWLFESKAPILHERGLNSQDTGRPAFGNAL